MSTPIPASHMAFIRARSGCSTELGARLSRLIEPGRQAQGCLQFSLQHSQVDPDVWLVSGFWCSEQAMSAYFSSPALMLFSELLNDGVVRSMDFQTFIEASAPDAYGEYLQLAG
ncbi:antibiotic biosynthesis monooxygenase family protein [Pseudomonas gessardii]|uniref:Antibiotic biosynthesis monooxygenase n=1 Tax=Pseudomonas gessardii TaxID=78544 RepID=A0A7Y1MMI2_9PSED|nr:antibiotic biosynthesis monooxygenase family protein [Pseudomonas gessardii]MBH3420700.1 antibiotic biosynthesis monooxygenase [Pseudomonas gessardii]MRU50037.1 antibiotic biosynthesis monooxygenase [Pseudomonas gessardii]NNA65253.1 antibiotic biosynthesis monooxygenase [Pseudomonas gessardii]NNA94896.1 antibiotic biosynthesis monooxygenase [Pseudomonas gessardii]ONH46249.1 antibiotic biosynthesis monooxygenase [Pseudomonas gessardii]